jgi:hypothetical protein
MNEPNFHQTARKWYHLSDDKDDFKMTTSR